MHTIIQGICHLQEILKEINCTKLFCVIDSSYPFLTIKDDIDLLDVCMVKFSDFTPNPFYDDVCKGIDLFKTEKCDAILAVGGGSSIDVAKCIKLAVLAKEGHASVIPPLVSNSLLIDGSRIPFIAIPTTAGTGSESTHNAVMYFQGAKQTITNDGILPDYAILEPSVLTTLPIYQKKCTMLDALCQSIESWWSVNSTEESKMYSKKGVELIIKYWKSYIFENDNEAAAKIMIASNYAGRAINISATTAAHAMSYMITSLYKLPHGHAVAICLPEVWKYMLTNLDNSIETRGKAYILDVFQQISTGMGVNNPTEAITLYKNIMKEMEMKNPVSMKREEELDMLSKSVNQMRLKNNPIFINSSIAKELYSLIIV